MKYLVLFTRQLAAMLRGGLPLVTALTQLEEVFPHKKYRRCASKIAQGLNEGYSFHLLLQTYPRLFPKFFVNMVEAGEQGDSLLQALETLAEYYGERQIMRNRMLRIMFYPLLLVTVALASGLFSLWHVVPTFQSLYATLSTEIPPATEKVFAAAEVITPARLGVVVGIALLILVVTGIILVKKLPWSLLAKLPLVGTVTCYWFSRVSSMIVQAGHTLELALMMASSVSRRGPAPDALAKIRRGSSLYTALDGSPGVLRSFIAQGEITGELPTALKRAADYYRTQVEEAMESFQRLLEPVSVLIVGGVVAVMLLVLMLPMLQLAQI